MLNIVREFDVFINTCPFVNVLQNIMGKVWTPAGTILTPVSKFFYIY